MTSKEELNKLYKKLDQITALAIKNAFNPLEVAKDVNYIFEIIKKFEEDSDALEMFKNALTIGYEHKPVVCDEIKEGMPVSEYIRVMSGYVTTIQRNRLDDKLKEELTQWIIENIDKETVKEWLENDIRRCS